jgi:general secretion pathway protein A
MYKQFFQLRQAPFSIAPDPHYLFMSERHREALAHLLFGIDAGGGFVLLTGEIGAGKTTVCRCFLEQVPPNCNVAYIFNPRLTAVELLRTVCEEFRLPSAPSDTSVKDLVDRLNQYLLASHAEGRNNVLIIDEAQNLSFSVLEQLRLLTNLETSERKLLQIILIGQPELRDMLARPELEQLAQRIIARYHLDALSEPETGAYVAHRLAVAGISSDARPFPPRLTGLMHKITRGVPRRINLLCDRALLGAYALGVRQVDRAILLSAAREVFGTESGAQNGRPYRAHAIAVLLLALAGGALLASGWDWRSAIGLQHGSTGGQNSPAPAPVAAAAGTPAAVPAAAPPAVADATPPRPGIADTGKAVADSPPAPAPAVAVTDALGLAARPAPAAASAPAAAPALAELTGLLQDASAEERSQVVGLARLWRGELGQGEPCQAALAAGLHCFQSAGGLAELRQLGRPAIVALRDDAGVQRHVLLVGLSSAGAELQIGEQAHLVSLVALGRRMPGRFLTLWRAPPDFRAPLKPGDRGADVDWVAARLSLINDYATPEPGRPYDAALAREVRAFQDAQGLSVDGVVGPKTYMALNRAAGVPEPRLAEPQLNTAGANTAGAQGK